MAARSRPRGTSDSRRSMASVMPRAMAGTSVASYNAAASPQISGSDPESSGGDRAPRGHRLDGRQAEALVEAREREAGGALVEAHELLPRHQPTLLDPVRCVLDDVETAPGEHEPHLGMGPADKRHRLDQALVVLVGPAAGGVEHEVLTLAEVGRELLRIDAEVDHVDLVGVDAEVVHDALLGELAECEDRVRLVRRPVVARLAVEELCLGEVLREVEVLHVVQRDDERLAPGWTWGGHGQGVVD